MCGLIYVNPRPSEDEIVGFYPETYSWKETVTTGSKITALIRRLEKVYRYHLLNYESSKVVKAARRKTGRLLDIGCGAGDRLDIFRRIGFDTHGVEISSSAEYASEHLELNVKKGDLFEADYPDSFFDVITLYNVLEHTHDPRKIIKELYRILKEDGIAVIQVPNTDCIQFKLFKRRWAAVDVPRDLYYFNIHLLKEFLSKERCQAVKVDHSNNFWHPPTLAISISPPLDPQLSWSAEASQANSYFRRIFWGILTLAVSPLAKLESLMSKGAIITIYVRKIS
jgi:SAM-dependent methyltransferase